MADKEEKETGFMGQIRRLSRRLSGNILSADPKDVRAYMARNDSKRTIYSYDNEDQMRIGGILVKDLAEEFGTPLYIYDINRIYDNFNLLHGSLKKNFLLCYAVKDNPNLAILNILYRLGAGFEVNSGGEISRCLAAGIDPSRIYFSGCGKSTEEIELAIKVGIYCINAESWEELNRIESIAAKHNKIQNIAIRINPELNLDGSVNVFTGNNYKFGVPLSDALEIYSRAKASSTMRIKGISCQIGHNAAHLDNCLEIRDRILQLADELRQESKICVEHVDFGGFAGLQMAPDSSEGQTWVDKLAGPILERGLKFILEPGCGLISDAGVLLTKIEYIKTTCREGSTSGTISPKSGSFIGGTGSPLKLVKKTFAIVDAGFNDFAHTALFGQGHQIVPAVHQTAMTNATTGLPIEYKYDVVGPLCETIDVFQKDLVFHQKLLSGEYLVISDAGAYGSSLSSNFMSRNKAAAVLITERSPVIIHERQKYEEQYQGDKLVPESKLKSTQILEEAESQENLDHQK